MGKTTKPTVVALREIARRGISRSKCWKSPKSRLQQPVSELDIPSDFPVHRNSALGGLTKTGPP